MKLVIILTLGIFGNFIIGEPPYSKHGTRQ